MIWLLHFTPKPSTVCKKFAPRQNGLKSGAFKRARKSAQRECEDPRHSVLGYILRAAGNITGETSWPMQNFRKEDVALIRMRQEEYPPRLPSKQKMLSARMTEIIRLMHSYTNAICRNCSPPFHCCYSVACRATIEYAKENFAYVPDAPLPVGHDIFANENGCLLSPELRPSCSMFACPSAMDALKGSAWEKAYNDLRRTYVSYWMHLENLKRGGIGFVPSQIPNERSFKQMIDRARRSLDLKAAR